jgi:hypothetical protein
MVAQVVGFSNHDRHRSGLELWFHVAGMFVT